MATTERRTGTAAAQRTSETALQGAWWKWGMGLLMCFMIYGAFFIAGGAVGFGKTGDIARVVFFHVPGAVLASICYFVGASYGITYLLKSNKRDKPAEPKKTISSAWALYALIPALACFKLSSVLSEYLVVIDVIVLYVIYMYNESIRNKMTEIDAKSAIAMEQGFLFCILATVTGSIFAGMQWDSYWNWDPREISIVIMLLLYASYLVLRSALASRSEQRAKLSAVYALVALVPAQYLIWAVPRIVPATMHPKNVLFDQMALSPTYKLVLYSSFIAFTMLYIWMSQLRFRAYKVRTRLEGKRG